MKKKWQEYEDKILRENYPSGGYRKCMELLFDRNKTSIQGRASALGIGFDALNPQKLLEKFFSCHKYPQVFQTAARRLPPQLEKRMLSTRRSLMSYLNQPGFLEFPG